jgi:hypothetical protein
VGVLQRVSLVSLSSVHGNGTTTCTYVTGKYPVRPLVLPSYQFSSTLFSSIIVSPSCWENHKKTVQTVPVKTRGQCVSSCNATIRVLFYFMQKFGKTFMAIPSSYTNSGF